MLIGKHIANESEENVLQLHKNKMNSTVTSNFQMIIFIHANMDGLKLMGNVRNIDPNPKVQVLN